MAVAAPARKAAPAPAPSRTSPPRKSSAAAPARAPQKKAAPARRPRTRPTPKGRAVAAPAPARKAPGRKAPTRKSPARKAPARKTAARQAPARAPRRARPTSRAAAVGGQLIPFAGRTAVAVGHLPDSGLMVRMTRGRAWIAVLGLLLAGIVGLNVVTLSFAASTGKIDAAITALGQENPILEARDTKLTSPGPIRQAALPMGLTMPASEEIHFTDAGHGDVATAAARLAAAGG